MKLDSIWRKTLRLKVCTLVGAGSLYAVVAGCDPEVQNALVQGVAEAAVSALEAMFTRDETDDQPGVADVPTVMIESAWETARA